MKRGISFLLFATLTGCGSAPGGLFGATAAEPSAEEPDGAAPLGSGGARGDDDAGQPARATGGSSAAPEAGVGGGSSGGSVATGSGGATMGTGGAAKGSGGLWCAAWGCGTGSAGSSAGGRTATGGAPGTGGSDNPPDGGVCDAAMCAGAVIPSGAVHVCAYSRAGSGAWLPTCGYVCSVSGCGAGGSTGTGGASGAGGDPTGRCVGTQGNVLAYAGACGTPADPHKIAACRNWMCVEFCAPGYTC